MAVPERVPERVPKRDTERMIKGCSMRGTSARSSASAQAMLYLILGAEHLNPKRLTF